MPLPNSHESSKTGEWKALQELQKYLPQAQFSRQSFDRNAYRNLLFYCGVQWIKFESKNAQWKPINLPNWFPKHQTNKFAVSIDSMKSVFEQSRPTILYGPSTGDEEDLSAADACDKISEVIDNEVDQERLRGEASAWMALAGNFFIVDGYDLSETNGVKEVNLYACLTCAQEFAPDEVAGGACPGCGGRQLMKSPNTKKYPIGKMTSEIDGPFSILFNMQAGYIENSEFLIRCKTYPTDLLKAAFPEQADRIMPGVDSGNLGIFYQRAVAYITNSTGGPAFAASFGSGGTSDDKGEYTTLYHLWRKPTKELPYGGEALIANEVELFKGEASTKLDDGTPTYPVTHCKFKTVPGRVLGKTPADDLISKQIQRNKIEAILQLGAERVSNPTWLLPTGIGVENITGEPGEKLWYNGFLQGLKPERIQGMDMPASLYRWLQMIDADFEDLAATYDILKGKSPEGVSTLGETQILHDRGLARFADGLNSWGNGWTRSKRIRLCIWKARATDERTRMVLGDNAKWQQEKFSAATITGNVDVRLEQGSVAPKSKAYQQMIYGKMIEVGLADLSDPLTRHEVLKIFDAGALVEGLDMDVEDAIKEREDFLESGGVRPREIVDNHAVHLSQHVKDAKSDKFFSEWSPEAQGAWLQHIEWHFGILQKRAQEQRQNDPMTGRLLIENDALSQKKSIELEALKTKKGMDLSAAAIKHGLNIGRMKAELAHPQPQAAPAGEGKP